MELEAIESIDLHVERHITAADDQSWIGGWKGHLADVVRQRVAQRLELCVRRVDVFLRSGLPTRVVGRPPWHE